MDGGALVALVPGPKSIPQMQHLQHLNPGGVYLFDLNSLRTYREDFAATRHFRRDGVGSRHDRRR